MKKTFVLLAVLLVTSSSAIPQSKFDEQTLKYYDSTRSRELITEVWLPEGNFSARSPLVVFSHGTGSNRLGCQWFCEGLASAGFIVAAVDHYGNTFTNTIPREFVTVWQRPMDIKFIITQLLKEKNIGDRIDTAKIYAAGFSLGGYTSLAVAGAQLDYGKLVLFLHSPAGEKEVSMPGAPDLTKLIDEPDIVNSFKNLPDLKDRRVKAVFVMAPAIGQGFTSVGQMKEINIPVYIIGAQSDSVAPVRTNAMHYKELLPKADFYLIKGNAGHFIFLNEGNEEMKKSMPVLFKDPENINRNSIHEEVLKLAKKFFLSL